MKKVILVLVTMFIFSKCYCFEYKYSEWSPIYPGKVKDKIFIEEEDRFLWYKFQEKDIKYMKTEDISELLKYSLDDFKYETNYSFTEPLKYKDRVIETVFNDYVFNDNEIDSLVIDRIGNIEISELEIYKGDTKINYKSYLKGLNDGKMDYINYYNKVFKTYLNDFDSSYKLIIHYRSNNSENINISYRAGDRYNIYSNLFTFEECDECTKEINIKDFKVFKNQYIPVYKYTDKLYKTYKLEKEYTTDYYKEYDGYIKDESTLRKYYRFIMNDYIILDKNKNIITNSEYCSKEACIIKYQDKEIENPKTSDNIYLYSSSFILVIALIIKKYLVLSKCNKSFNNYSNI